MRTTVLRFGVVIVALAVILYYFYKPKNVPITNNEGIQYPIQVVAIKPNGTKELVDLSSLVKLTIGQLETILKGTNMKKPPECYKAMIEKAICTLPKDSCNDYEAWRMNMDETIKDIVDRAQVLPINEGFIITSLRTRTTGPANMIAVFDENNNMTAFRYDICSIANHQDTAYIDDWNKDGHEELIIKSHQEKANYKVEYYTNQVDILDFNSIKGQIIDVFSYAPSGSHIDNYTAISSQSESDIQFENPNLVKLTTRNRMKAEAITSQSSADFNATDSSRINDQKKYIAENPADTTTVTYFQKDSKTFVYKLMQK
jgi:hypothetical protein